MNDTVLFEARDDIAIITLNRPDQRNAINPDVCEALRDAVDRLENTPKLRVGILRGAGPVFCAGMDLKAFQAGKADDILLGEHGFAGFVKRARSKPIIAQVQGAALAGGFEVMLACDMVVAAQDAVFGLPEPTLGIIAGAGGAVRLGAHLPPVVANDILLTGQTFSAEKAHTWGLINQSIANDDLDETTFKIAQTIARNAPKAIAATLRLAALRGRADIDMWAVNDRELAAISDTHDAQEGIAAFLEKRKANWSGN
jgi:enoyl-CoA hydratase